MMRCTWYDAVDKLMNLMAVGTRSGLRSGCAQSTLIILAVGNLIFHKVPMIFELYVSGLYHEDIYEQGQHSDEGCYILP